MTWQSLTGASGAWSGVDWTARAADTASADPYLTWADATGFADLGGPPAGWMRVIIELEGNARLREPRRSRFDATRHQGGARRQTGMPPAGASRRTRRWRPMPNRMAANPLPE